MTIDLYSLLMSCRRQQKRKEKEKRNPFNWIIAPVVTDSIDVFRLSIHEHRNTLRVFFLDFIFPSFYRLFQLAAASVAVARPVQQPIIDRYVVQFKRVSFSRSCSVQRNSGREPTVRRFQTAIRSNQVARNAGEPSLLVPTTTSAWIPHRVANLPTRRHRPTHQQQILVSLVRAPATWKTTNPKLAFPSSSSSSSSSFSSFLSSSINDKTCSSSSPASSWKRSISRFIDSHPHRVNRIDLCSSADVPCTDTGTSLFSRA